MRIHISNLSLNVLDSDLRKMFSAFGEVSSAIVLKDKINGRSRGSATVDMLNEAEGEQAISKLHQSLVKGKKISLRKIEYNPERPHMRTDIYQ